MTLLVPSTSSEGLPTLYFKETDEFRTEDSNVRFLSTTACFTETFMECIVRVESPNQWRIQNNHMKRRPFAPVCFLEHIA